MRHVHEYSKNLVITRHRLKDKLAYLEEMIKECPSSIHRNEGITYALQALKKLTFTDKITLFTLIQTTKGLQGVFAQRTEIKNIDRDTLRIEYEKHAYSSSFLQFLDRTHEEAHAYLAGIGDALNWVGLLDVESEVTAVPLDFHFDPPELQQQWEAEA